MNGATSEETRELLRLLFHDKRLITNAMVDDTLMMHLRSAYAIGKILEAGPKLNALSETEARAVQAPTLIIWGKDDALTGPAAADRLAAIIPGARKLVIDNAGHMPQWEKPDEFNRTVAEFLKHSAGPSSNRK